MAGFADASGRFLPLVCTLNAARVLDAAAQLLGVDHAAAVGAGPERPCQAPAGSPWSPTWRANARPTAPHATGAAARAAAGQHHPGLPGPGGRRGAAVRLADGLDALVAEGVRGRAGACWSAAEPARRRCARIAPAVLGHPVVVPRRPSTWPTAPPTRPPGPWPGARATPLGAGRTETHEAEPTPAVRERYAARRDLTIGKQSGDNNAASPDTIAGDRVDDPVEGVVLT